MDRSRGACSSAMWHGRISLVDGEVAERHAAELCRTLQQKILTLDDYVEVYPTHVGGLTSSFPHVDGNRAATGPTLFPRARARR